MNSLKGEAGQDKKSSVGQVQQTEHPKTKGQAHSNHGVDATKEQAAKEQLGERY
jgi:hypothetical protein